MSDLHAKYLELRARKEKQLFEAMQPGLESSVRRMCRDVLENPELAGTTVEVGGSFERGDFGAVLLQYPTVEEAHEYIRRARNGGKA